MQCDSADTVIHTLRTFENHHNSMITIMCDVYACDNSNGTQGGLGHTNQILSTLYGPLSSTRIAGSNVEIRGHGLKRNGTKKQLYKPNPLSFDSIKCQVMWIHAAMSAVTL